MDLRDVIKNRTSVRTYKKDKVSEELILEILESGNLAPSAGNIQPWDFIIIRDDAIKESIVETTYIGNDRHSKNPQKWMLDAPVFILVCGNKEKIHNRYGDYGVKVLLYQDCAACVQNMLLTIVDLGLSSCYVSGFRIDELSDALDLPEHIVPVAVLPIGYNSGQIVRRQKVDLMSKIYYEKY